MRRKLIQQDAFDRIKQNSVTVAERELVEAAPILAKTLETSDLELHCFTENAVVYKTKDDNFVHAGFDVKKDRVNFTNIEELVIDESTRQSKIKSLLSEMIDAIIQDDSAKAEILFNEYLGNVRWSDYREARKCCSEKPKKKTNLMKEAKKAGLDGVYSVAQNVLEYVDFMKFGPTLAESEIRTNDKGQVTDVSIGTIEERNRSRIQRAEWRAPNFDLHTNRGEVAKLTEDQAFCKAIANLKRQNSFSDPQGLEEALDNVVKNWPQLIYVTENELSQLIKESLEAVDATNYDDQTCEFMAEGILRKACSAYQEKVAQILHLANAKLSNEDAYLEFQNVVEQFYPALDEKFGLERKAFVDLYESLEAISKNSKDNAVKQYANAYLGELADILNGHVNPDLAVAEEAANWLSELVEANVQGAGKWNVSNKPHQTVSGDHPNMAKLAQVDGTPAKHNGDWGAELPSVNDDGGYKAGGVKSAAAGKSWGQEGGSEVFPKLKNPYVPKPFGDYTMKGEKGVDKDSKGQFGATWKSKDTYPSLQNPYVPKEAGKSYKMKEKDLVVDK
jgi:hypothetical protein